LGQGSISAGEAAALQFWPRHARAVRFRLDFAELTLRNLRRLGSKKEKTHKQARKAQFQARPQSCAQRRSSKNNRFGTGSTHSADALGEICFCDFSAADLRNS
jgi:hypothetical protein